jgi:uncharacterized protein (TIGR03435 family)
VLFNSRCTEKQMPPLPFRLTRPWLLPFFLASAVLAPAQTGTSGPPHFDVATIRTDHEAPGWQMNFTPDGFVATGVPLLVVIHLAYGGDPTEQWQGGPDWARHIRFDIVAKFDPAEYPHVTLDQRRAMLQQLLADRFHLKIHHESRDFPLFDLVVAKGGAKLTAVIPETLPSSPVFGPRCEVLGSHKGDLTMHGCTMADLAINLRSHQDLAEPRAVRDKTGLTGRYDLELKWAPVAAEPPTEN